MPDPSVHNAPSTPASQPAAPSPRPTVEPDTLVQMVSRGASIGEIGTFLDDLTPAERWAQVDGSPRDMQRRLFELAADNEPVTLEDFVPADVPDLVPVVHRGWNTLPLPSAWRRFAKPMCRPGPGERRLFGYNEAPSRWLVGPGYFVMHGTEGTEGWPERGAQVVDYYQIPDGPVPEAWPWVRPNWLGLQIFVYHQTRDFMRKVSRHVTIGSAYKWERSLASYFVLVREDAG